MRHVKLFPPIDWRRRLAPDPCRALQACVPCPAFWP